MFRAEVGSHDTLPLLARRRPDCGCEECLRHFTETLGERLQEKRAFAAEVLVKASVRQAGVLHYGCNRHASQALRTEPSRGVFDNFTMGLSFVLAGITHN